MKTFIVSEFHKALVWLKGVLVAFWLWCLRAVLRIFFAGVFLFLVGGGCVIFRSFFENKIKPDQTPSIGEAGSMASQPFPAQSRNKDTFQDQIRDSQGGLRSWGYTARSIKRDIEYWFRGK